LKKSGGKVEFKRMKEEKLLAKISKEQSNAEEF
jgi:hypothetical protein